MNFKEMKCGVASSHQSTTGLPIPPPPPKFIEFIISILLKADLKLEEMKCGVASSSLPPPPRDELLISLKRKFEF